MATKPSIDELASKAIDIKGKRYVLVSDRVLFFNEAYPKGSITTELVSGPADDTVVIKATVMPEPDRIFTGYSQATWGDGYINKTSALENAETSAVGRALAFMGIGVLESIASADEINKAQAGQQRTQQQQAKMAQDKVDRMKAIGEGRATQRDMRPAASVLVEKLKASIAAERITDAQKRRMWTIAARRWADTDTRKTEMVNLLGSHGFEHSEEVTGAAYDEIIRTIEGEP